MPNSPAFQLKVNRYEDLTAAEMVSMEIGPALKAKGDGHEAHRVIQLSLDLEHLISVLDLDPAKCSKEELGDVRELRDSLTELTGLKVSLHVLGEDNNVEG